MSLICTRQVSNSSTETVFVHACGFFVFCFSLEAEGDCDSGGAYIYILNNQEYFEHKNVAAVYFVQHSGGLHVVLFQYKSFTFHIVFKNMVVFVHLCSPIFLRRVVLFHSVLLDTP